MTIIFYLETRTGSNQNRGSGEATGVYDDIEQRGKFDIVWHILYWCV